MMHDADGQRVVREVGADTHYYFPGLTSDQVLAHVRPDGELEEYIYTPKGTAIARITPGVEDALQGMSDDVAGGMSPEQVKELTIRVAKHNVESPKTPQNVTFSDDQLREVGFSEKSIEVIHERHQGW